MWPRVRACAGARMLLIESPTKHGDRESLRGGRVESAPRHRPSDTSGRLKEAPSEFGAWHPHADHAAEAESGRRRVGAESLQSAPRSQCVTRRRKRRPGRRQSAGRLPDSRRDPAVQKQGEAHGSPMARTPGKRVLLCQKAHRERKLHGFKQVHTCAANHNPHIIMTHNGIADWSFCAVRAHAARWVELR